MSPNGLRPTRLEADRVISTFSFDSNLEPSQQNLHQGEVSRPPESLSRATRASARRRVKEQWNATWELYRPITNDGLGFHSNMPISELTERVTRAIEASDVSSTPLVAETTDGATITKTSQPSTGPLLSAGARGKLDSQGDRKHGRRTMA